MENPVDLTVNNRKEYGSSIQNKIIATQSMYIIIIEGNTFLLDRSFRGSFETEIIIDSISENKGFKTRAEWISSHLNQMNETFDLQ